MDNEIPKIGDTAVIKMGSRYVECTCELNIVNGDVVWVAPNKMKVDWRLAVIMEDEDKKAEEPVAEEAPESEEVEELAAEEILEESDSDGSEEE